MNGYDLEYIDKLRIHELRDFARKLGVNSPTTMKKEELIGKISAIINNDTATQDKAHKYVKNYKDIDFFKLLITDNFNVFDGLDNVSDIPNISEEIEDNNDKPKAIIMKQKNTDHNTPYSTDNYVGFSFKLRQNEAKYTTDVINEYAVSGFVDIHPDGYGILRFDGYVPSDKDCYLTTGIVKKYKLKKGYFITGKAKHIIEGKPKVVYTIDQIENTSKFKNSVDFEDLQYNGLGEEYYLEKFNFNFKRGERHYIESMTLKDAVTLGYDIVDENGVNVKLISIKTRPEEQYQSHQKMEVINVLFNKSDAEVVNTVHLVIERIKREMEMGKSNVLIIHNFSELVRIVNVACDGFLDYREKFNPTAINKIHNILYCAKNVSDKLHSGVICIDKNGIPADLKTLIELEFHPLFNTLHKSLKSK